jgi:hypothetical protein
LLDSVAAASAPQRQPAKNRANTGKHDAVRLMQISRTAFSFCHTAFLFRRTVFCSLSRRFFFAARLPR